MAQNTTDITATTNIGAITWGHAVYTDITFLYGSAPTGGSPSYTYNTLGVITGVSNADGTYTMTPGNYGTPASWSADGGGHIDTFTRDACGTLTGIVET
jgi:hypothetical protein